MAKPKGTTRVEQMAQEQGIEIEPIPEAKAEIPQVATPSEKATPPTAQATATKKVKEITKIILPEGEGRIVRATARATLSTGQYENLILEAEYLLGSDDTEERVFAFFELFHKTTQARFKGQRVEVRTQAQAVPQATIHTETQGRFVPAGQMATMTEPTATAQAQYPDWRGRTQRPDGLRYPEDNGEQMSENQGKLAYVLWCKHGKPEAIRPPRDMTKVDAMRYIDTFNIGRS